MSSLEEVKWLDARYHEMRAIGVTLRTSGSDKIGWCCEAVINMAVYCAELADTQREAVEKVIANIVAARMAGLKLNENNTETDFGR